MENYSSSVSWNISTKAMNIFWFLCEYKLAIFFVFYVFRKRSNGYVCNNIELVDYWFDYCNFRFHWVLLLTNCLTNKEIILNFCIICRNHLKSRSTCYQHWDIKIWTRNVLLSILMRRSFIAPSRFVLYNCVSLKTLCKS